MSWSYAYDPQVWPALITAILTAVLGWYGWQRRSFPAAKPFAILCLFAFLWAVGCILEISATDFSSKIFWIKFQGIWQQPEATTWPWFVLAYAGLGRWLTRRNLWLMFVPAFLSILVIVTNDYHHLLWKDFLMGDHVIQVFGVANWVLIGYSFVPVLVTFTTLLWLAFRSQILRWPAIIMLIGMAIAFGIYWLVNIYSGFLDAGERILFTMGVLALSFSVALFQFRVLDPVPLARSTVIEQMGDGMLVTDLQGKIVDLNQAAGKMLGATSDRLRGQIINEVLPLSSNFLDLSIKSRSALHEITLGNDKSTRYYSLNLTLLNSRRGHALGHLVLLHDITERKRAQEQILEHQQLLATLQERERLARELHDSTGQALGYVNIQVQAIRKLVRDGRTAESEKEFTRLLEVVRDSHKDVRESILNLKTGVEGKWSFVTALKQYLVDFQSHHGIRTELVIPEGIAENVFETGPGAQILRVIQEALTNARKHSHAQTIKVTIDRQDSQSRIIVSDDGVGFETDAKHDNHHFGLNFMRERMQQIGGSVTIDSRPGAGTAVIITAPISQSKDKNHESTSGGQSQSGI